jgi:hypothetical protein
MCRTADTVFPDRQAQKGPDAFAPGPPLNPVHGTAFYSLTVRSFGTRPQMALCTAPFL